MAESVANAGSARIMHEQHRLSRKPFNRKPEACAFHISERTDRPKRLRTNLRSVPGFGLNERLQQLETIRVVNSRRSNYLRKQRESGDKSPHSKQTSLD